MIWPILIALLVGIQFGFTLGFVFFSILTADRRSR